MNSDPSNRPVAVFDSGLGGLTVAAAIHRRLPQENLVFLADMARVPYASLSPVLIERFATECFQYLLRYDPKVLVVACNTVSSVCLEQVSAWYPVPVIGVVEPTARAAAAATHSGRIGVIATKPTVKRHAYEKALGRLLPTVRVTSNGCPLLVPLVEEGWIEGDIPRKIVEHYLEPVKSANVDVLILGCTHYEYFRSVLQAEIGELVALIDTPLVASEELATLLERNDCLKSDGEKGRVRVFSSDANEVLERVVHDLFPQDDPNENLSIQPAHIVPRSAATTSPALPESLT